MPMDKNKIVRIELALLAVLAVLLVLRVFRGLPALDGEVTMSDIDRADLVHDSFVLSEQAVVNIVAFGSMESATNARSASMEMAAYPWIMRRSDRTMVWKMDPAHSEVVEGTLLKTEYDVTLDAGTYDLYYASYGSSRSSSRNRGFLGVRLNDHWTGDRKQWQVALKASNGQLTEVSGESISAYGPESIPNLVWTSGTMRDRKKTEQILVVDQDVDVSIYSIGEICAETRCGDYGVLENLATGKEVWRLTKENSRPAGGSASNFVFDDVVSLERGMYRASYATDPAHAYGRWHGNPPYDPTAWGMTLFASNERDAAKIRTFDVWEELKPVVKLAPAGSDVDFVQSFDVVSTTDVFLFSMGEIDGESRYDYGWLDNRETGETVWSMATAGTRHAGGNADNTIAEGYVRLVPGKYALHYKSDDSHAYGDWNRSKPDHEERWGITMFPISDNATEAIKLVATESVQKTRAESHDVAGEVIFSMLNATNDQSQFRTVDFDEEVRLHIRAIGEISQSGEYDYGWIVDELSNATVWKMTRRNTIPAGGDERFRMFDDFLEIGPGEFSIHYETDDSYSFGDFRDSSPDFPNDYGMKVVLVKQ